jgi:hypothetical protein
METFKLVDLGSVLVDTKGNGGHSAGDSAHTIKP